MEGRDINKLMKDLENLDKNMQFARKEKEWERERAELHTLILDIFKEGSKLGLIKRAKDLGVNIM